MSSARPLSHHSFNSVFTPTCGRFCHARFIQNAFLACWKALPACSLSRFRCMCRKCMAVPHMHGCPTHLHGCATHAWLSHTFSGCATCAWLCHTFQGCATHMHGCATHMHGYAKHLHGCATCMAVPHTCMAVPHPCMAVPHMCMAVCVVTPPSSVSLTSLLVWPRGGELSRSVRSRHVR